MRVPALRFACRCPAARGTGRRATATRTQARRPGPFAHGGGPPCPRAPARARSYGRPPAGADEREHVCVDRIRGPASIDPAETTRLGLAQPLVRVPDALLEQAPAVLQAGGLTAGAGGVRGAAR